MESQLDLLVNEHWALIVAPPGVAPYPPPSNLRQIQRIASQLLEDRLVAAGTSLAAFGVPLDAVMHLRELALELPEPAFVRASAVHARLMCAIVVDFRCCATLPEPDRSSVIAVLLATAAILFWDAEDIDPAIALARASCSHAPALGLSPALADCAPRVERAVLCTLEGSIRHGRWDTASEFQDSLDRARLADGRPPTSREEQARARRFLHVGQAAEAVTTASRAVDLAVDPGDQLLALQTMEEIRHCVGVPGARRTLHPTPELAAGLVRLSDQIGTLVESLDRGELILEDRMNPIADDIERVGRDAVEQGLDPRAMAVFAAKLALGRGDTDAFEALRPLLRDRAAGRGAAALEAEALLVIGDEGNGLAAIFERGIRELRGVEPLAAARTIQLVWVQSPVQARTRTWLPLARWLEHVVASLESHRDWGSPEQTMIDRRTLFPEFEMTCFFIYTMVELSTSAEEISRMWSLMHRLFVAFTGIGLRLARTWRPHTASAELAAVDPLLLELSAAARERDIEKVGALRLSILSRLYASRRVPQASLGAKRVDSFAFPQALILRTSSFIHTDDRQSRGATFVVDNFTGSPRVVSPELRDDLDEIVETMILESDACLDPRALARLSRMLVPWPAAALPATFGIRASGIIQSVPWAALTTVDGVKIGDVAVPVLLTDECDPEPALAAIDSHAPILLLALPGVPPPEAEPAAVRRRECAGASLTSLPGSRGEVLAIREGWPGATTLLLGAGATRGALRAALASRPLIIHLATHGFCHPTEPACSYVALASESGGGEHDALTFDEITLMDLRGVRLVVLSACSTMRGTVRQGEGILALSWAFRAAGAGAVISTRWDVADDGAALLWPRFYAALAEGVPIPGAFHFALQTLRADPWFQAPYEWASYQMIA